MDESSECRGQEERQSRGSDIVTGGTSMDDPSVSTTDRGSKEVLDGRLRMEMETSVAITVAMHARMRMQVITPASYGSSPLLCSRASRSVRRRSVHVTVSRIVQSRNTIQTEGALVFRMESAASHDAR